jgi:hypothetical protein
VQDYFSYLPYLSAVAIALGALGLLLSRQRRQAPPISEPCEVVNDWRPTGKIDFAQSGRDDAPLFTLRTEDFRVLRSMSGAKRVEVRWRPATLEEAKRVASWSNNRDSAFSLPLPGTTDAASLVPELSHRALPGDGEPVHIAERPH